MNQKLNAVLELARRYDYDSGHSHQVECLAGTLFMELEVAARSGQREPQTAGIRRDSARHWLLRQRKGASSPRPANDYDGAAAGTLLARKSRLSRTWLGITAKPCRTIEHTAYAISLSDEDKRRVNLLAPIAAPCRRPGSFASGAKCRNFFAIFGTMPSRFMSVRGCAICRLRPPP